MKRFVAGVDRGQSTLFQRSFILTHRDGIPQFFGPRRSLWVIINAHEYKIAGRGASGWQESLPNGLSSASSPST